MPNNRYQNGVSKRKTYEVIKATRNENFQVEVGGKVLPFGRLGNFRTSDPGVAREIEKRWGSYTKGATKEVVVAEVEHARDFELGHRYTFAMPVMPWKRCKNDGCQEERRNGDYCPQHWEQGRSDVAGRPSGG